MIKGFPRLLKELKMKGKFIVIEGLDGAGKSHQTTLLTMRLNERGFNTHYIHFPQHENGYYGTLISKYLRGEFGSIDSVDPHLVSLLFAGDRLEHQKEIKEKLDAGFYVLCDRYVYSNIAFQLAKMSERVEKEILKDWILDFEYNFNKILKPDLSIFLDVPIDFVLRNISREREENKHLNGGVDIHEKDVNFQKKVLAEYKNIVNCESDLFEVKCYDKDIFAVTKINKLILDLLEDKKIL